WDALGAVVTELADELELRMPLLIGHSFGAQIAQIVGASHSLRPSAIVCIDNAAGDRSPTEELRIGWDWPAIERRLASDPSRGPMSQPELRAHARRLRSDNPGVYGKALARVFEHSMVRLNGSSQFVRRPSVTQTLAYLKAIATRPAADAIYEKTVCPTL